MKHLQIIKRSLALLMLWLSATNNSSAYIVAGANGANGANSSEISLVSLYNDFSYWNNVISMPGGTGVYLGAEASTGFVLTANHLGIIPSGDGAIGVDGKSYQVATSRQIGQTDLRLYELDLTSGGFNPPSLPNISILDKNPTVGEMMIVMGRGTRIQGDDGDALTSDMISLSGYSVYQWGGAGAISWGQNQVATLPVWLGTGSTATWTSTIGTTESTYFANFSDPGAGNYNTSWEAISGAGDSGGPSFIRDSNGDWALAGITSSVLYTGRQPVNTATWGTRTSYVNLPAYASELPDFTKSGAVPESSGVLLLLLGTSASLFKRKRQ